MNAAQLALGKVEHALAYFRLRAEHPEIPARLAHRYLLDDDGRSLSEFICANTTGHRWSYSGTAYGGDDARWGGEGRCYCVHCGADGDA